MAPNPESTFDLIIIGAGINGAGIARDAALRGLKVFLIDKGDIGSGTSSWSTRLIHGGLRYLEHGEFALVRESLREREILLRIAPHLVKPLSLMVPFYGGSRRGRWTIRAGMIAYDLLSFGSSLPYHKVLSVKETLERAPGLETRALQGAAVFSDAQVEFAERLVLENALAAKMLGAQIQTYAHFDRFIVEDDIVRGIEFTDQFSGESRSARGRLTVNAAGPWVDQVMVGASTKQMIGGTKGSHLVVAPFQGASAIALYAEAQADGRPFFIIPWNGNLLLGTTDKRFNADLDKVQIENDEVTYLLTETNHLFPHARLDRKRVLYTYSGVRPLPYTTEIDEQRITRRHFIRDHAPKLKNLLSVIGGKLTTYRNLAEELVDLALKKLGRPVTKASTAVVPLPGAVTTDFQAFSEEFQHESGLPENVSARLLRIYGTRAPEVLKLTVNRPELGVLLDARTGAIAAEVVFAFEDELAKTLTDCLLRRTMIGLASDNGVGADALAAKIAIEQLGWSEERARTEISAYREVISRLRLE
jgi:glycerol-3-phosphate dehydrogenase